MRYWQDIDNLGFKMTLGQKKMSMINLWRQHPRPKAILKDSNMNLSLIHLKRNQLLCPSNWSIGSETWAIPKWHHLQTKAQWILEPKNFSFLVLRMNTQSARPYKSVTIDLEGYRLTSFCLHRRKWLKVTISLERALSNLPRSPCVGVWTYRKWLESSKMENLSVKAWSSLSMVVSWQPLSSMECSMAWSESSVAVLAIVIFLTMLLGLSPSTFGR